MQDETDPVESDQKRVTEPNFRDSAVLLQHVSKEIELTIQNTYSMRMKVMYTSWIGPFILLGAMVVANRGPLQVEYSDQTFWIAITALAAYFVLAFIFGRYERGNWRRCDKLRSLAVKLSGAKHIETDLRDERYERNVLIYYFALSSIVAIIFVCCLYFSTVPLVNRE